MQLADPVGDRAPGDPGGTVDPGDASVAQCLSLGAEDEPTAPLIQMAREKC